MRRFVLRKAVALVSTALVASFVVFASLYVAPGDPESVLFGATTPPETTIAAVRAQYHLDDPFLVRYGRWLFDVARGDLGTSFAGNLPVSGLVTASIGTTLRLIAAAAVLLVAGGVCVGLAMGLRPGPLDSALRAMVAVSSSVPAFVTAATLSAIFAVGLGWFPAYGTLSGFWGGLRSLVLPTVSLALVSGALLARVTRASVRAELARDYVTTARARSLPESAIVRRHLLPNAAPPIVTAAGMLIASLFAGTVVVENAFGMNGLGSLLVASVNRRDFPTVQAVTLLMVIAFTVASTIADLVNVALDPRLRAAS